MNGKHISARTRLWLLAGVIVALSASPLHGGALPPTLEALGVTATPDATGTFVVGGGTIGWSFTVAGIDDLPLTHLGYYDLNADGLGESHEVGVWDDEGELLISATVSPADTLLNSFRYTPLVGTFILDHGRTYVIGAYHTENVDNYLSSYGRAPLASYTLNPLIVYESGRISFGPDFVEPILDTGVIGRFGPNFQFLAPAPEPGTALLLGLALAGFGATARLRVRTKA